MRWVLTLSADTGAAVAAPPAMVSEAASTAANRILLDMRTSPRLQG
jgi:hypothetical protein